MKNIKKFCFFISTVSLMLSTGCEPVIQLPKVTTLVVSDITQNSAISGGNVIDDGGAGITECGVCWSLAPNPKIADNKTIDGNNTGTYKSSITGLLPNKTYYLRAYAINNVGIGYGLQITFQTNPIAELSTNSVTNITTTSAICGGKISSDYGTLITSRGICWNTSSNPTINDNKTINGMDVGAFCDTLTKLLPNMKYYIRAYATSNTGTVYGNEVSFQTLKWFDGMTVTDIDGNIYHTVKIGTQIWMVENLKTKHYVNGDLIQNIIDLNEWDNLKTGAYSDFDNNPVNSEIYGKLYNWYVIKDARKIAPIGWHVSSYEDWDTLCTYLGGINIAGGKLKETGLAHWFEPNVGATNEVGFTALEGGAHLTNSFNPFNGNWWISKSEYRYFDAYGSLECPWLIKMYYYNTTLSFGYTRFINWGLSIRCVMD